MSILTLSSADVSVFDGLLIANIPQLYLNRSFRMELVKKTSSIESLPSKVSKRVDWGDP